MSLPIGATAASAGAVSNPVLQSSPDPAMTNAVIQRDNARKAWLGLRIPVLIGCLLSLLRQLEPSTSLSCRRAAERAATDQG